MSEITIGSLPQITNLNGDEFVQVVTPEIKNEIISVNDLVKVKEAETDGQLYARKNGGWEAFEVGGGEVVNIIGRGNVVDSGGTIDPINPDGAPHGGGERWEKYEDGTIHVWASHVKELGIAQVPFILPAGAEVPDLTQTQINLATDTGSDETITSYPESDGSLTLCFWVNSVGTDKAPQTAERRWRLDLWYYGTNDVITEVTGVAASDTFAATQSVGIQQLSTTQDNEMLIAIRADMSANGLTTENIDALLGDI